MKRCSTCKEVKELTEFHKDKGNPDGLKYICKACIAIKRKAYYSTHVTESAAYKKEHYETSGRNSQYIRKYNITLQQYDDMLAKQDGHCAICDAVHNADGTRLCVDHDHKTGKIRGILCTACNTLLGYVNDDISILAKAIDYLNGHKE